MWLLLVGLMISSFGCRAIETGRRHFIQGPIKCYRDRVWAERAYNLRYGNCERPYSKHFEAGFIDGYSSVCCGGDGFVPAMPPEEYWGNEYQSGDGARCVNSWFEGYPAGAAAAKQDQAGDFNDIYVSRMMQAAMSQEKSENVLPADVPVVKPEHEGTAHKPSHPDSMGQGSDPVAPPPPGVMPVGWDTDDRFER